MEYFNLEISAKVQLYFQIIKNCAVIFQFSAQFSPFDATSRTFACVFGSMHAFSSLEMAVEPVVAGCNRFDDIE